MGDAPATREAPPYIRPAEADNVVVLTRHVEVHQAIEGLDGETWTITRPARAREQASSGEPAPVDRQDRPANVVRRA